MPELEDEIKRLHLRNTDLLLAYTIETKRLRAEIDRLCAELGRLKNAQDKDNPA